MEHWYNKEGKACHFQPTKKGAANPERPTNIKDARKLKLFPSITTILKTLNIPSLERWKQTKIVEACFNRPPIGGEDYSEYESYILRNAFDGVSDAASLGTRIHANINSIVKGQEMQHKDETDYAILAMDAVTKLGLHVEESEITVVNEKHGYAGTTDLAFTKGKYCGIVDFKSTRTKEGEPIHRKLDHIAQIAAYHVGFWTKGESIVNHTIGYNIYISTTEKGRIDVVEYDADCLRSNFEFFLNTCAIWRHKNEYDPRLHN